MDTPRTPDSPAASAVKNATTGMIAGAIGYLFAEAWIVPPLMSAFSGGAESQLDVLRSGLPLLGASAGMATASFVGNVARNAAARGSGAIVDLVGRIAP